MRDEMNQLMVNLFTLSGDSTDHKYSGYDLQLLSLGLLNHLFDVHVSLDNVEDQHYCSSAECDLPVETAEDSFTMVQVAQVIWIFPLASQIIDQLLVGHVSDSNEPSEEGSLLQVLVDLVFSVVEVSAAAAEVLDLIKQRSKQLQMRQPFRLVVDVLGDESAQLSIAIMDPLAWVHSWFYQNERLVEEAVELFQWAVWLLQKYVSLQLRAKDDLAATHEAQVRKPYHLCPVVDQCHQLDLLLELLRSALVREGLADRLDEQLVDGLDQLEVPGQYFLEDGNGPLLELMVRCDVNGAAEGVVGCVPGILPAQFLFVYENS